MEWRQDRLRRYAAAGKKELSLGEKEGRGVLFLLEDLKKPYFYLAAEPPRSSDRRRRRRRRHRRLRRRSGGSLSCRSPA